jgi:hypothetical protein
MTPERAFWRGRVPHLAMGGAIGIAVALGVATLSARPAWQSMPEGIALVRLSLAHSGVRNCRDRTAAELAALPANMRDPQICDRRRAPVRVEMDVDGQTVLALSVEPSGLAGSGPSRVYHRVELPAGRHRLDLRLAEDPAAQGFAHAASFELDLAPAESVAVDFSTVAGGFFVHRAGH